MVITLDGHAYRVSPALLEVGREQDQIILSTLQPVEDLLAEASRFAQMAQFVNVRQGMTPVTRQAIEALLASDADCPGDGQSDGLKIIRVQVLRRVHQASDDTGDGVLREVASTDVGSV
jgi:hypothetical protein